MPEAPSEDSPAPSPEPSPAPSPEPHTLAGTTPDEVEANYNAVVKAVTQAAARSGRRSEDILLVAVTKYAQPEHILRLLELGHRDFGENRVQQLVQRAGMSREWLRRASILARTGAARPGAPGTRLPSEDTPIRWHMIGHVQRNKAKKIADCCRLVHSVDSLRVAEELQLALTKGEDTIDVLVQVDCSGDDAKHGCPMPAAMAICEQIDSMYSVRVRGLMTMAPHADDPEAARPVFIRCRELFEEISKLRLAEGRFNILSMGMTGDYRVAIEEGANVVRVGSAIFGERPPAT
ncbi:MAG: YggS family pyridoxal phosphate-dependent enzyme [Planctomycetota bacterium]